MSLDAKSVRIDLDGKVHTFPIGGDRFGIERSTIVRGEAFRDWFSKRDALEWEPGERPTFHLVEIMVPANERRLFKLVG